MSERWFVDDTYPEIVVDNDGLKVAATYGDTRTEREQRARLIAAAPELLEALQPFADYACDLKPNESCSCHNCRARAVINKAKGGGRP